MAANERQGENLRRWQRMLEMLHRTMAENGEYNIIAARNLFMAELPEEPLPSRQAFMRSVYFMCFINERKRYFH